MLGARNWITHTYTSLISHDLQLNNISSWNKISIFPANFFSWFYNAVCVLHTKSKMLWKEIYTYFLNV